MTTQDKIASELRDIKTILEQVNARQDEQDKHLEDLFNLVGLRMGRHEDEADQRFQRIGAKSAGITRGTGWAAASHRRTGKRRAERDFAGNGAIVSRSSNAAAHGD